MPHKDIDDRRSYARRRYGRDTAIKSDLVRRTAQARERNRAYVNEIKRAAPCVDCGHGYPPYVMQFDHLDEDKDRDIANLVASPVSLARLAAEIAKCEVVCANCHAERTHQRRQAVNSQLVCH